MAETLRIKCFNPQQGHQALNAKAWPWLKSMLLAGHRMTGTFTVENRTNDQNAKFHAICGDIAKSGTQTAGEGVA